MWSYKVSQGPLALPRSRHEVAIIVAGAPGGAAIVAGVSLLAAWIVAGLAGCQPG